MLTNMKRLTIIMLLALVPFLAGAQPSGKAAQNVEKYRPGQVIVKFKSKDAITLSNTSQQGRRGMAASAKAQVNDMIQQLGITEVESLMPLTSKAATNGLHRAQGKHDLSQLYLLHFDSTKVSSVEEAVNALRQLDDVAYAEPNYIRHTFGTASDYTSASLYNEQWYLQAINMPYLWDQPIVSEKRPVIAIIDSGIFYHKNLAGQWDETRDPQDGIDNDGNGFIDDTHGWDFLYNSNEIFVGDYNEHGTHCAGIAVASPDQGEGIVGANPDARLLDVRVMDDEGRGTDAAIVQGVDYAVATGVDIISMSLGGYDKSEALREALENASQYCIIVAAAGNETRCVTPGHEALHVMSVCSPSFPAAYPFVLSVQATDAKGELATFSNFDCDGPNQSTSKENYNYDLRAPGVNMLSCVPVGDDGYDRMDGTSMACPLVAGAISRLMQCGKVTDFNSLRDLLIKTSGLTIDMKAAYDATAMTTDEETFQCDVSGVTMTFHKTSPTTIQLGDGNSPAISTTTAGSVFIPNYVNGLLVTSVADNAFKNCNQLTEVIIPYKINNVGEQAFSGCSQLNHLVLQTTDVPTGAANAFDESTYTSCHVEVPKGCSENYLTVVPWSNFGSNLESLEYDYGDNISKTIGDYSYSTHVINAYKKQVMLSEVSKVVEDVDGIVEVPDYIDGYQIIALDNYVFGFEPWLKQVTLPDCIPEIPFQAFASCHNLETVNYPSSLKSVGDYAFRDCISFKNGHIPGYVKTIGPSAFENTGIEELILGEGVETLGLDAFHHCLQLKKIKIPSTMKSYFSSLSDLPHVESIEVAEDNPGFDSRNNCNALIHTKQNILLVGCKNTVIPDDVTSISGFWGTKGLTELHISKNVNFINPDGMRNLEDLVSVSVDKDNYRYWSPTGSNVITEYGGNVLVLCSNSVIPEDTEIIEALSAYRNSNITSVTIPSAMGIGDLVFAGCPITSVTSLSKKPKPINYNAFFDKYYNWYATDNREPDKIYENATLYVPHGTTEVYKNTYGWNYFQNIEELPAVVRGDVNGDGVLTEADYTALVDHLLGRPVEGYHPTAADADEDGRVTARDFISLKTLLAGQPSEIADESFFSLLSPPSRYYPGAMNEAKFWVYNYKALYFLLKLPEGMTFEGDNPLTFDENLGDDFVKDYTIEDNVLRVVICPALNSETKAYQGYGFTLKLNVASDIAPVGNFTIYNTNVSVDDKLWDAHNLMPYYLKEPPVKQLTFAPGQQWQTFYSTEVSCALEEGKAAKAYIVTGFANQKAIATPIEGGIPERCMVLVGLDDIPTKDVSVGLTARIVSPPTQYNFLEGQQFEATGINPYETYVLYDNEFVLNSGTSVPGGKGYLNAFRVKNAIGACPSLKIVIGDETTPVREEYKATAKGAEWYDLQGRRLSSPPSTGGLYIKNRQKVVIK